ncbi:MULTISPECIES: lantibiotic dehydratase family protein [Flavobacterium]|uniref:Lantibiotic dehydratase N-terminal domain-containing protein n=1 Tax=Flavobacterium ginsengisoli TaxID=871694 RepID=A0ABP7EUF7_9FLAO|nr:lantibiotic dehydratase family protein [Flavobacterium sp. IB48]MBJ2123405.1 lantibiotic dehydratase family protein [Flavobacterium sp. IB48]
MHHYKITAFSDYVLRTPLFPLSAYLELVKDYSAEKAKKFYKNSIIKEAINLASPELRNELDKWALDTSSLSNTKTHALELTFLKYIARMSSRCTPFGLFAGCCVGKLNSETDIVLRPINKHKRFTQFDMQYWIALLQDIAKRKEAALLLKYFPNSSIYETGDFYRFIEYKYANAKREHAISALRKSDLLTQVLNQSKSGMTVNEIASLLADSESEKEQAEKYIFQLIDFHFLVPDIDASLTGNNEWEKIIRLFNDIPFYNNQTEMFKSLKIKLSDLDISLSPSGAIYKEIKTIIDRIGTTYDEKYLFQTDLNLSAQKNNLNQKIPQRVLKAIEFLNSIQTQKEFQNLENFKKAFTKRYETREMPLSMVLDTEIGIGYLQNHDMNDTHDLLENFSFRAKPAKEKKQVWTDFDFIMQKKLHDCYIGKEKEIQLNKNDFPESDYNLKNIPVTFSVMIEVLNDDQIVLISSGNVSAAKLLGRFCSSNTDIHNLIKQIIEKENGYHDDKILAEIVHIPESRTGNILKRPNLREHEISYLCKSGVSNENNFDLNDLYVSVRSNRIVLRSQKHNKEILPCMSNAHNFTSNSLPVYHFLCDLEMQDSKPVSSFNWGVLESHYIYFPRVVYNATILSKAKWKIKKDEIKNFHKIDESILKEHFLKWRSERNLPRFVNWINGDNTLLFDFESLISIKLFLNATKSKEEFFLEEFLFVDDAAVKNNLGENFSNQIILSYYKEKA